MEKLLFNSIKIIAAIYILICVLLYLFQERLIFFPYKLDKSYRFAFAQKFEERNIKMKDGIVLHGLLFKADSSKGVIFYLHGNAGSLSSWGDLASTYTDLKYDLFMLDYRGYGKSEGNISSQAQLFNDVQIAYEQLKKDYAEDNIIVLGYSIGTGPAAKVASMNHPRLLILQAPYYSLTDVMKRTYPIIPTFILKYKLDTYQYLKECKMPVVLFHGTDDGVIYHGASLKLKTEFKSTDTLITLQGQGHNGMTDNETYRSELKRILMGE